ISPIASPVAGESAVNVSPDTAPCHAPSTNIPVLLKLSDATWAHIVEGNAHQVADRDDAAGCSAVQDRQVAEPAVDHHDACLLRALVRVDRLGAARHPVRNLPADVA